MALMQIVMILQNPCKNHISDFAILVSVTTRHLSSKMACIIMDIPKPVEKSATIASPATSNSGGSPFAVGNRHAARRRKQTPLLPVTRVNGRALLLVGVPAMLLVGVPTGKTQWVGV